MRPPSTGRDPQPKASQHTHEDAVSCSRRGCAATNPAGPHGGMPSSLLSRRPASPWAALTMRNSS
eukprot:1192276-Alexandrium_andersonii.AAC.1